MLGMYFDFGQFRMAWPIMLSFVMGYFPVGVNPLPIMIKNLIKRLLLFLQYKIHNFKTKYLTVFWAFANFFCKGGSISVKGSRLSRNSLY